MARVYWVICLTGITVGLPGCHRRPPAEPAIPPFAEAPADIAVAPPDTSAVVGDTLFVPDSLAVPEPTRLVVAPPDTSPATVDTAAAPAPVTVDLSRAEKIRLAAAARADLQDVQRVLAGLDREKLSEDELDRIRTVESLVESARERLDADDVQAAASLAHKARLLAEARGS